MVYPNQHLNPVGHVFYILSFDGKSENLIVVGPEINETVCG